MALTKVTGGVVSPTSDYTIRNVTGVAATFTGNVNVEGVLTYEDVTNVDSVGVITARTDIHVGENIAHLGDTDTKIVLTDNQLDFQTGGFSRAYLNNWGFYIRSGFGLSFLASSGPSPAIKSGGTDAQDLLLTTGTDNPTRVVIASDGKVGIATITPRAFFDVRPGGHSGNGAITFTTGLGEVGSSNNAIQSINGVGSALQPLGYRATEHIFATQSAERVRINSNGNLLLGTDTETNNIRLGNKFGIVGTAAYTGMSITNYSGTTAGHKPMIDFNRSRGTSDGSMTSVADDDGLGEIIFRGSDGSNFEDGAAIRAWVDGTPANDATDMPGRLTFHTSADGDTSLHERLRIESSGAMRLKNEYLRFQAADHQVSDFSQKVGLKWTYETDIEIAKIEVSRPSWSGGPSDMLFHTCNTSGTVSEKLRINSTGQVGICTQTIPSDAAVHIGLTGAREYLRLDADNGNTNAYIEIQADDNRRKAIIFKSGGTRRGVIGVGDSDEAANATSLFFSASDKIAGNDPHMVIDSNGNIGIGEANPATLLEVSAGTNKNLNVWSSGAYATGITIGSANDAFSGYTPVEFRGSEFYFHNGTDEKVRIHSNGNVGINSTAPSQKLDVMDGTIVVHPASKTGVALNGIAGQDVGVVRWGGDNHHAIILRGSSSADGSTITGGNTMEFREYGAYSFKTGNNSGTMAERLRIASDGQLTHTTNKASGYIAIFDQAHADNPGSIQINSPTDNNLRPASIDLAQAGTVKWSIGQVYASTSDRAFHICSGSNSQTNSKFVLTTAGKVGIGTDNPSGTLTVHGVSSSSFRISKAGVLAYDHTFDGSSYTIANNNGSAGIPIVLGTKTGGGESLRIDASGRVMIATTDLGRSGANELTIGSASGDNGITIRSGTDSEGNIYFSDGSSGGVEETRGIIRYDHNDDALAFFTGTGTAWSAERLRINSSGQLIMTNAATQTFFDFSTTNNTTRGLFSVAGKDSSGNAVTVKIGGFGDTNRGEIFTHTNHDLGFATNNSTTQMKLSTSGSLCIGGNARANRLTVVGPSASQSGANSGTMTDAVAMFYGGSRATISGSNTKDAAIIHIKGQINDQDANSTGNHVTGQLVFTGRRATGAQTIIENETNWIYNTQNAGSTLKFYTAPLSSNGGTSPSLAMTLHNDQHVTLANYMNISSSEKTGSYITSISHSGDGAFDGGLVFQTRCYEEYHFKWTGQYDHTVVLDGPNYLSAWIEYQFTQTNGGSDTMNHVRGKWANNHTTHTWVQDHASGGASALASGVPSFTASDQSGNTGNSGSANARLTIFEDYQGSGLSMNNTCLIVRIYYASGNMSISHTGS